jgi:site-specific DNA-methyltransferase (adenine-specific)
MKQPVSLIENIDCMEGMKKYPDKFFDLAIVDPPYNIASQQKRGVGSRIDKTGKMNQWNHKTPDSEYFDELFRVSKSQIIWGANNYYGLPATEYFCIWNKKQTVDNFASAEYAWVSPSLRMPAKVFDYGIHKHNSEIDRIHPTQKPIALYKWLLSNYATCRKCNNIGSIWEDVVGDGGSRMQVDCEHCEVAETGTPKILDTHLGSGSSRIAAYIMGFDFYGFEIDKDYYDAAEKRFKEQTSQQSLFDYKQTG